MTTLPVAPLVGPPSPFSTTPMGTVYFPHFADGGGWATQVILVNPTDRTIAGTVGFPWTGQRDGGARAHDPDTGRWSDGIGLRLLNRLPAALRGSQHRIPLAGWRLAL